MVLTREKIRVGVLVWALAATIVFTLTTFRWGKRSPHAGDPNAPGGLSHALMLTLAFEPTSGTAPGPWRPTDCFRITLSNTTTVDLEAVVEPTEFHGRIVVTQPGSYPKEYFANSRYRARAMTSTWVEPVVKLKKGTALVWNVPVREMVDLQDERRTIRELNGASAYAKLGHFPVFVRGSLFWRICPAWLYAKLEKAALIRLPAGYIESTTSPMSARIHIKVEGAPANGSQPPIAPGSNPSPLRSTVQDTAAQVRLGLQYAKGEGRQKDLVEAYKWLHVAAEQGNLQALMPRYEIALEMNQQQIIEAQRRATEILDSSVVEDAQAILAGQKQPQTQEAERKKGAAASGGK